MRLCTYIVKVDTGLAPNPFWGWCTLALCTPNHMGVKLNPKDWIVGFLSKVRANKLLFAMQITEVLHFDDYFRDKQFSKKIPILKGSWKERCGDNIYYLDSQGNWQQAPTVYHRGMIEKDTKHPYAFVSNHFYYFGQKAPKVPTKYQSLIPAGQGVKCNHDNKKVTNFIVWLNSNFSLGIHGLPIDNKERKNQQLTSCST